MQSAVGQNDYQVVSKPSLANKVEANEENTRLSVIEKKLKNVNTKLGTNDPN